MVRRPPSAPSWTCARARAARLVRSGAPAATGPRTRRRAAASAHLLAADGPAQPAAPAGHVQRAPRATGATASSPSRPRRAPTTRPPRLIPLSGPCVPPPSQKGSFQCLRASRDGRPGPGRLPAPLSGVVRAREQPSPPARLQDQIHRAPVAPREGSTLWSYAVGWSNTT